LKSARRQAGIKRIEGRFIRQGDRKFKKEAAMKTVDRMHDRIILRLLGIDAVARLFISLAHLTKYVGVFV
jgi:hypothetical protein